MSRSKKDRAIRILEIGDYIKHPSPMECRSCGRPMIAIWKRMRFRRGRQLEEGKPRTEYTVEGAREYQVALVCEACDIWINADVQREQAEDRNRRAGSNVSRESQGRGRS